MLFSRSSNITIQQSPLSNSNGPHSASSQSTSYSSPLNRNATLSGRISNWFNRENRIFLSANGNLPSPEDELQNLIKYLKENAHRLQLLIQKFTNENNLEKLRQVQMIQQQIVQFVNNPTYEAVPTAKNFRDVLERIPVRVQIEFPSIDFLLSSNLESNSTSKSAPCGSNDSSCSCCCCSSSSSFNSNE